MAEINFECKECGSIFDCDVGKVTFPTKANERPKYENKIVCPKCGIISSDKVLLTEIGQGQMTALDMETW
ncbi:MAG: hypothetical protein HZA16_10610 [Nitrospirae bacterium]|nr:hypothetical protein [Nitrospirota bacterium]